MLVHGKNANGKKCPQMEKTSTVSMSKQKKNAHSKNAKQEITST